MRKIFILLVQSAIILTIPVFVAKGDSSLTLIFYFVVAAMFITCLDVISRGLHQTQPVTPDGRKWLDLLLDNGAIASLFLGIFIAIVFGHSSVEKIGHLLLLLYAL